MLTLYRRHSANCKVQARKRYCVSLAVPVAAVLCLTFSGIGACQISHPTGAPVLVNPPIMVRVQNPVEDPWVSILKLLLPGVVGALSALVAVWITSRTTRRNLETSRRHEDEAANRDRDFELKKSTYFEITKGAYVFEEHVLRYRTLHHSIMDGKNLNPEVPQRFDKAVEAVEESKLNLTSAVSAASLFLPDHQSSAALQLSMLALTYMVDDTSESAAHFRVALRSFIGSARNDLKETASAIGKL
jgi:hypothetical protein